MMSHPPKNNETTENVKDAVLVASIYNGWKEMSRSLIESKQYNINRGKCLEK